MSSSMAFDEYWKLHKPICDFGTGGSSYLAIRKFAKEFWAWRLNKVRVMRTCDVAHNNCG